MRICAGKIGAVLGLFVAFSGMSAMAAEQQVTWIGEGAEGGAMTQKEERILAEQANHLGLLAEKLSAAKETEQIITVVGGGTDSSLVNVAYFKKNETGTWTEEFCVPGYCGYNGMSADKREGDRRTPTGTYSFVTAFGILKDPGSQIAYKQLEEGDFWVDDSNSRYYNQMVNIRETARDWDSAEELMRITPSYNYVLALDYNTTDRIPGKGSAIFLHGIHPEKTWTEGCIAIPEEQMKRLLQELKPDAKIVIMPSLPLAVTE